MPIYIDDELIESFIFPGGECHVRYHGDHDHCSVKAYLNDSNDIMKLLLLIDAIKRNNEDVKIFLTIPYFPYARQDRSCNYGEPLSVKVMANLINSLECYNVTIYDPHSDVTAALLDNCNIIPAASLILNTTLSSFILNNHDLIVVAPDTGASKRAYEIKKLFNLDMIQATKVRSSANGQIMETKIDADVEGKSLIIIDDICDGGSTFIQLGKLLRGKGASKLYLYVTHGIFSKGLDVLRPYFNSVYCYHTMLPKGKIDNSFLTMLENRHED